MKKFIQMLCGFCLAFAFQATVPAQTITNQPQSATNNNGATATFTVGASNATSYQWQFNSTNLNDGTMSDGVIISGSATSALTLEDVTTNEAGTYTVVVNGSVTSSPPAVLTIVPGTIVTFTFSGLLTNAPGSNMRVQLFDHDKPATVENFIHYITAGAFTNMFFDRCAPGFVLQGGDDGATDQTNTSPPIRGWDIASYVASNQFSPPFPHQVDSEFGVGPLIHNRFGTIAMALASGESNSATSAFFFNLVDNSAELDQQYFTVFGRILNNSDEIVYSNVLAYFNTVSNGYGAVAPAEFLDNGMPTTIPSLNLLPVNYVGTNAPANANLVFCDFSFPTSPPAYTNANLLAVSITSPAPNAVLTNGNLIMQGTAGDNIGVAVVICVLTPQAATDGTYPYPYTNAALVTNYAVGTTNWSLGLSLGPGSYDVSVQAQNGAGYLSAPATNLLTVTAVVTNGNGTVTFTNGASNTLNAVGYPFQDDINYDLVATPGSNQLFVSWSAGGKTVVNPEVSVDRSSYEGFVLTAKFIANGIPNGIAFTYPASNAVISTDTFNIAGTISNVLLTPVSVTCQIYSTTTYLAVGPPLTTSGTNTWSVTASNLPNDSYVVQAMAVDSAGDSTVINEGFTVAEISSQPQNVTVNNASTATFSVVDSNALSYQWQFQGTNIIGATNSTLTLEDVNSNQMGDYTVIIDGSVTSSNAELTVVPGTIVTFIFSGFLSNAAGSNVQVQLFDHDKPATVENFIHYISSGAFTNMFFEQCIPGSILQGGDYGASNRTDTNPPLYGWDIQTEFTMATNQNPPFPPQVDSEFNVGPLIHNRFGTIAMALGSGSNSASSGFFFNLADNSAERDPQSFTVFGRILDGTGTNVLEYFNTFAKGSGIATNGELIDDALQITNETITNLPVNYAGTNAPANANLVFCGFQLPTNTPVYTNLPTVSITSPGPNAVLTNGNLVMQGTATDDVAVAVVICILTPQAATDGTYPYPYTNAAPITNYAMGTTNWSLSLSLSPGSYDVSVQAQNGAGYLSAPATNLLTVTVVVTNGSGTVTFTNGAHTNLNAVGYPFQDGITYDVLATAGTNQLFVDWTASEGTNVNPEVSFSMFNGFVLTATFISNGIPNSIAFTYPASNAVISTNGFNITGTISNVSSTPVLVTCTIFSEPYGFSVTPPLTNSGTTNWSVAVMDGLATGSYTIQAVAVDSAGDSTVIAENFSVAPNAPLQLNIAGPGTVKGATNGEPFPVGSTFQVTAIPDPGRYAFYAWYDGTGFSLNPVQTYTMAGGLALTAIFVTNNISNLIAFTYPAANGIIGTGAFNITGTISNVASSAQVAMTFQIFSTTNMLSVSQLFQTSAAANWSVGAPSLGVGSYTLVATAVDPAGDSTLASEDFTVQYAGALRLITVGKGSVSPVTNGEMLPLGTNFEVRAAPASGQVFYTWNNGTQISTNATQTYTMASGLTLTATFIPSNTAKGISFTYPAANALLSTNTFPLKGRIAPGFKPAGITCQVFQTNGLAIGPPLTTSGTTTWSVTVTNLPGGYYTVEAAATNGAGMSTVISENFVVLSCAAAAGTYSGLFICTNGPVAPTNSGFLTFTVEPSGLFSGKLMFPAYAPIPIYPTYFDNIGFTTGYFPIVIENFHGNPLNGAINLDLNSGTGVAIGTIFSDAWSSELICYRAVTKLSTNTTPATGKYILNLQLGNPTNGPGTNGYAALVIGSSGAIALSGALPDDTTFSESARVSKDGIWPLYAIPAGYKTNGMLLGWEIFSNSSCSGRLYWYKAPNIGAYYSGGVGVASNMPLNSTGTKYSPPATTNYSMVFQEGTNSVLASNELTVTSTNGQFKPVNPTDKLAISLSANGVLTGHFVTNNDGKALQFKGAFFGQTQGGSGFIPDGGGQTGCFELEPDPR